MNKHKYMCAECGKRFETEKLTNRCPDCHCKVLIHLEGEARKSKNCSGNCSPSCSCCH